MTTFHFSNAILDDSIIKNLTGDENLIADYIIKKSIDHLKLRDFVANTYQYVLAIIFVARRLIIKYGICELHSSYLRKCKLPAVEFDNAKLQRALNNFMHFNGTLKFDNDDFFGQTLSTEDIEYDLVKKVAKTFGIVPPDYKYNIHSTHYQIDIYKESIHDLFTELAKYQQNLTPKQKEYLKLLIIKELRKASRHDCHDCKTYFEPFTPKIVRSNAANLYYVDGKYLFNCGYYRPQRVEPIVDIDVSKIEITGLLELIKTEFGCIVNTNPNALRFFENPNQRVLRPSRIDYFDFIQDYKIYDYIYRDW